MLRANVTSPHYKGNRRFSKEGNKIIIKPEALDIVWGGDQRYWILPFFPHGYVTLVQVSWLQVTGYLQCKELNSYIQTYSVTFRLGLKPDAFGLSDSPVYFVIINQGRILDVKTDMLGNHMPGVDFYSPTMYFNYSGNLSGEIQFGMYEIWSGRWKGGLLIHDLVIQPAS